MTASADEPHYDQVELEQVGAVAVLRMNRPRYRNAQSWVMREEMDDAFARCANDDSIKVVVLLGAGDHFSGGHDLGTPEEVADRVARPFPTDYPGRYSRMWDLNVANALRWRDLPKPTIAGVKGYCIFAGWLVASTMDVIIAGDDATFLPEFVQYFTMPWDVGSRKAKEILFEGRFVSADEACELGFVNEVVPVADLEARVMEMAHRFAETDAFRLRQIKQVVNGIEDIQGFRAAVDMAFLRNYHLHEGRRADLQTTPALDRQPLERVARAKTRRTAPSDTEAVRP